MLKLGSRGVPKLIGFLVREWEEPERHGILQVLANAARTQIRSVVKRSERTRER